jgi:alkylation response protein AidB-like acyl-CoA dehydrogenase
MIDEMQSQFERLLTDISPPQAVRAVERGEGIVDIWSTLQESGFLDALVPEEHGGAGLSLGDVGPLIELAGRYLLPVPFAQTMAARALLAAAGSEPPGGPVVLMTSTDLGAGYRGQRAVPFGLVAEFALVDLTDRLVLTALPRTAVAPTGVHGSCAADISWPGPFAELAIAPEPAGGLRCLAAVLRAGELAGAMARVLQMTVDYAGQRQQFAKPIGKMQAIQQQLAVLAEQVLMASMAAQIGCAAGLSPGVEAAAVAKQVTSAAAAQAAAIAHGVHGAIGVSEEYDLQLYTRRLFEWRLADGSESWWAAQLGGARLESEAVNTAEFLRQRVAPF